jgi:hypothetical protein
MLQLFLATILILSPFVARADQMDYFCLFATQAAAEANPVVGQYYSASGASWDLSQTFPGIKVTTPSAILNGVSTLTGFWIIVSTAGPNATLAGKVATTGPCYIGLDRDVGKVNGSFVINAGISGSARTALTFSPIPEGSAYPSPLGK